MPKLCTHPNCQRPVFSKGKCGIHYQRKKLNRVSEGQRKRLEDYREKRDEFLKANPKCQFDGCNRAASDVHHKLHSRQGGRLTDSRWFMAACREHHNWIHANHKESVELGHLATSEQRHLGYDRGLE